MDNDVDSSSSESFEGSASDECFHDSIEAKKDNNRIISSDDDNDNEVKSKSSRPRSELVLDLRNVPMIAEIVKSDDEKSEKLSAVIEQPEEHVASETIENDETGSLDDPDKILRERIKSLEEVIIDLREQLKLEVSLWRKERDEFQMLRERSDLLALEEATAAARAAAEAYAAESPLSNDLGNVVEINPVQSLSELTILEYEKKLAKYQDALALAQAEKRYNMRRKLIANTYRQKLCEVERMCNEELENIRQSAITLQSLRRMASKWSVDQKNDSHGDGKCEWNSCSISEKKFCDIVDDQIGDNCKIGANDAEVNMTPEVVAARFSYMESSKYERSSAALKKAKATQGHLLVESNSLPSNWYASSTNC